MEVTMTLNPYAFWVWVSPDAAADLLPYAVEQLDRKMMAEGFQNRDRWEWFAAKMTETTIDDEPVLRPQWHPGEPVKVIQVNLVAYP